MLVPGIFHEEVGVTATDQLTTALAAEHAAIYGYGALGGRLSGAAQVAARQAEAAHRERRDAVTARLSGPVSPAEPAYALPFTVTDQASALRLAVLIEERTARVWRAALPVTQGEDRKLALDALVDAACRASQWRQAIGEDPALVAFPGKP